MYGAKAYQDSFTEAWSLSQSSTIAAISNSTKAIAEADHAKEKLTAILLEAEKLKKSLKNKEEEISKLSDEIKKANNIDSFQNNIQKIAKIIAADPDLNIKLSSIVSKELQHLEKRISGITLKSKDAGRSSDFSCGNEQKTDPKNLSVMYGSRDGTGCGVTNRNYYKEIFLDIPK